MEFKDLVLEHIAPGLGCIVASLMFVTPLKAVQQIRDSKHLGDFNPLPLVAIVANCTAWLLYGCVAGDPYVIAANEPGLLLGWYMVISCYGFADAKVRDAMLRALVFFVLLLSGVGIVAALFCENQMLMAKIFGYTAEVVLLCYYAAPLSTLAEVLRTQSSDSLYPPACLMNTVNGVLWVAYGVAIQDTFIIVPNAVGAALGVIQLGLIQCFTTRRK